ncbi:hypothetical protein PIROE2DRAFT_69009 [Piromyces sp. E2]|nr:hypothetical protein PIROE2DRAFT_69009 [Piromyces sp. E2]|eukprot:OUM66001.1 hypothetical protein PIROE2DRAFT_69009 [Piromyces sp. E2]
MVNINNNISMMNVKDSNVTINSILEKNGQKTQFGNTNATNNIENLNDPNNNSPNYDIDKFITISKFPQFKTILETQYDKISAIESHPLKPEIAVSGHSGLLQIYNYLTKELIVQRLFEYEEEKKDEKEKDKDKGGLTNLIKKKVLVKKINKIESIAYSTNGTWIAVGFTNGSIKIVDSIKLSDILTTPDQSLQICSVHKPITQFSWSFDDSILAAADDDNGVAIIVREEVNYSKKNVNPNFKPVEIHGKCLSIYKDIMENNNNTKNYYMGDDTNKYEWNFIGRYQSHWKKIINRMIVEYDLENSSFINGIKIKVKKQLEQTSTPSALCINNTRNEYNNNEDFFITANNDYKLKLFNSNTFLCRKTVMSPNYGSPINKMCILPIQNIHQKYLAYSTQNSIIGVLKLPLSGNPYDNLGVMAHSVYLNHRPAVNLTKQQIDEALGRSHEFEMPNIESEEDEENDVYYMGETDKQEYLENFKFKKTEEDEASIIKKILKSSSTTSTSNSNDSLTSKSSSKDDISSTSKDEEKEDNTNANSNDSQTEAKESNENTKDENNNSNNTSDHPSDDLKKSTNSISSSTNNKKPNNKNKINNNNNKEEINLDDEDQTEARYVTMKMNESERKEKMEKARQRREMLKSRDNGKFSRSALLSLLQQYGESLSAELFEQYINELLKDNSTNYKQLAEFFTLDEFIGNVLSFEEELIPETIIEKLNHNENIITNNNVTTTHTISTESHTELPQLSTYEIGSRSEWMNDDNESDTEPY